MINISYDYSGRPRPELAWLNKDEQYKLVDLERKFSDIPWLPIGIPKIVPDDQEQFINFFNINAINGVRQHGSYDEPNVSFADPHSSYNLPYWKTLEIYRSELAAKWFGTDTIANKTIDAKSLFPKLYQQIFDQLPYKEIFFIRFWSNLRPVGLHRDQDWTYNLPLSFRSLIYDTNSTPTFFVSKTKSDEQKIYVDLPKDTNTFAFNNGAFWHGADHYGHQKILMVVSGIPDVTKYQDLLISNVATYNPKRVYNNNEQYTVYNITSSDQPLPSVHADQDIKDLYTLLLTAPEIVNVEEHVTFDKLRSELRVIFWNQTAYYKFSERSQERYQAIVSKLNQNFINHPVEFFRHTSAENYSSEFPETIYPKSNVLIDWTLISFFKQWFIDHVIPIGKSLDYYGYGELKPSPVIASRFKKDRTSTIVRRRPHPKSRSTFPDFIAYNFESAIETASIKNQPYIYNKFMQLCERVEALAEEYVIDCDNSAVLVAHNSLGEKINLHTHRITENKQFTFTICVRITFNDVDMTYTFFEPLLDTDENLPEYYKNTKLLEKNVSTISHEFSSKARSSILLFNGSYIPHTVNYTNDIYLFFVYDNVTLKPDALSKIQSQSQRTLFQEYGEDLQLYFFDL